MSESRSRFAKPVPSLLSNRGSILGLACAIALSLAGCPAADSGSGGQGSGSGGSKGSGGSSGAGTGGGVGSGGKSASGGASSSGGSVGSGGTTGSGGATGSGGGTSSGGSTGTGGASTGSGGSGSGGSASTGGVLGGGGTPGSGGGSGTASGGSGVAAVVTDDFEAASISTSLWKIEGSGPISLTTSPVHGGKQALKVVGGSGRTMLVNTSAFPLPAGVVYFKVWMRFETAGWDNHVGFIESSPGSESQEVRFGGQKNAYNANLAADGDGLSPNPFAYPSCPLCLAPVANQWACVRGMLDFTKSAVQLYVGDTLAVNASMKSDWHSGNGQLPANPTQIGFGWAVYGGVANTVYYDDLAIGHQPISCP